MDNVLIFLCGVLFGVASIAMIEFLINQGISKLFLPKIDSPQSKTPKRLFAFDFIDEGQAFKALNGLSSIIIVPVKPELQEHCPHIEFGGGEKGTINYHSVRGTEFKTSIVDYKLKRIDDLTEEEIIKNGFKEEFVNECYEDGSSSRTWVTISAFEAFRDGWNNAFPDNQFGFNPYVWVIEFKVLEF